MHETPSSTHTRRLPLPPPPTKHRSNSVMAWALMAECDMLVQTVLFYRSKACCDERDEESWSLVFTRVLINSFAMEGLCEETMIRHGGRSSRTKPVRVPLKSAQVVKWRPQGDAVSSQQITMYLSGRQRHARQLHTQQRIRKHIAV